MTVEKLTYAGDLANLATVSQDRRHRFVKADIDDSALIGPLLDETRPRATVNLAAESHVDRSISGPAQFIKTNIVGTFNLLESVRRYHEQLVPNEATAFRFLHISTYEVRAGSGNLDTGISGFSA